MTNIENIEEVIVESVDGNQEIANQEIADRAAVLSQICGYGWVFSPEGNKLTAVQHQISISQDSYSVYVDISYGGLLPTSHGSALYYKVFLERKNSAGGYDRVDWAYAPSMSAAANRRVTFSNINNAAGQTLRVRLEMWNYNKTVAHDFYNRYLVSLGNMYNTLTFSRG